MVVGLRSLLPSLGTAPLLGASSFLQENPLLPEDEQEQPGMLRSLTATGPLASRLFGRGQDQPARTPGLPDYSLEGLSGIRGLSPPPAPGGATTGYMPTTGVPAVSGNAMQSYQRWLGAGTPTPAGYVPSDLMSRSGIQLAAPAFQSLVQGSRELGINLFQFVGQGYRSYQQQVAAQNNPNAADPGHSMHQYGLAIDTQNLPPQARAWLVNHGWFDGSSFGEPWHLSYGWSG